MTDGRFITSRRNPEDNHKAQRPQVALHVGQTGAPLGGAVEARDRRSDKSAMTELHVSLPATLDAALQSRIIEGGYLDAPEYVRDLLRRDLGDHVEDRRWLKAMIDEGLGSGVCDKDAFEILDEIIAEDPDLRG